MIAPLCYQGTVEAANVCAQISALTVPSSTLTGLTLNSGEIYNVNVTVSASGRTSGSMSQTVSVKVLLLNSKHVHVYFSYAVEYYKYL